MDYFVVDNNQFVFRIDANEFSQPMTHYVEHPIEIDFHFNNIAYNKGSLTDLNFDFLVVEVNQTIFIFGSWSCN